MTDEEQKIHNNNLKLLKKTNEIIYNLRGTKDFFSEKGLNNPKFIKLMRKIIKIAFTDSINKMNKEFYQPFIRTK